MLQLSTVNTVLTFWLSSEAATDVLISGVFSQLEYHHRESLTILTAILLFTLHASKTGFAKSDQVVSRLMRTSLQTGECIQISLELSDNADLASSHFSGLFTAVFAIMCMVLFLTCPGTQLYLIFGLPISRVYTSVSPCSQGF